MGIIRPQRKTSSKLPPSKIANKGFQTMGISSYMSLQGLILKKSFSWIRGDCWIAACHVLLTRCQRSRSCGRAFPKIVSSSSGISRVSVDGGMANRFKLVCLFVLGCLSACFLPCIDVKWEPTVLPLPPAQEARLDSSDVGSSKTCSVC